MTDREKVIEELKELCKYLYHEYNVCYRGDEEDTYNRFFIANKALELLKVHEPVKPKRDNTGILCGLCGQWIGTNDRFCSNCGREVKWDAVRYEPPEEVINGDK